MDNNNVQSEEIPEIISHFSSLQDSLSIEPQIFSFNQSRDTLLTCENGTVIYFSKNSFVTQNEGPTNSKVILEIKECYEYSDFIGENLTTTSDGEVLETGGMINISAFDTTNEELLLKGGQEYVVFFPKQQNTDEMQLFYGNRSDNGIINWSLSPNTGEPELTSDPGPITSIETELECKLAITSHTSKIGDEDVLWEFSKQSGDVFDYFDSNFNPPSEVIEYMCENNSKIEVNLTLTKEGDISDIFFVQSANKTCDSIISQFIHELPLIDMSKMGELWNLDSYSLGFSGRYYSDPTKFKETFEQKYESLKDKAVKTVPMAELNYYIFSA